MLSLASVSEAFLRLRVLCVLELACIGHGRIRIRNFVDIFCDVRRCRIFDYEIKLGYHTY